MAHIHTTDSQHDLTVTAYIARLDTNEPKVLLHMHRKLNMLLPIGGHVELLETPWQAVAHELTEESGYTLSQLRILQPKSRINTMPGVVQHPYPIAFNTHEIPEKHFHTDISYAFTTLNDPEMETESGESLDLRWLSSEELDRLTDADIHENVRSVYHFIINEALQMWDHVRTDEFALNSLK